MSCPIDADIEKFLALVGEFAADDMSGEAGQRIGDRLDQYFATIADAAMAGMTLGEYTRRQPTHWSLPDSDVVDNAAVFSKRKR